MEHGIRSLQRRIENVRLGDVSAGLEDFHARVFHRFSEVLRRAAYEIVVNDDLADILPCELVDAMRADEPSSTNHHKALALNVHNRSL